MKNSLNELPLVMGDGELPFALNFKSGLPPNSSGPVVFLLDNGSIHEGKIVDSKTFKAGALLTFSFAGAIPEQLEIPIHRVIGHAYAGPQHPFTSELPA
ncbi:hypothetical protein PZT57_30865 [Pseudomonas aeruginosa]|uniref:hypothetical protein n=1 Tax=Pseudomonas aeruginosa TaxID=287 RepID=UPI002B2729A4|nr:hypothetical protein [Pseudomonas aeruginosa]MEA8593052.1 hypothetical protein [Pseudomonas aeruginosa]